MIIKTKNQKREIREKGAAALIVSMILLSLAVVLIPTFIFLTQASQVAVQNQLKTATAYYAAEAAVEDNIYRIKKGMRYSESNNLTVEGASATVAIASIGSQKIITVESQALARHRKIEAVLAIEGVAVDFHYGAQVGNGGLEMANASKVTGSVYSNGNIVGDNKPEITGDAFAASSSSISGMKIGGKARAYNMTDSQVGKNATIANQLDNASISGSAYAANITKSQISGDATYITIDERTTVGGRRIATTTAPEPLARQSFPISEEQLDQWEREAADGGTISSPCPYEISKKTITFGPKKINCDLIIRTDGVLILTGPVWVKGNISVENNGIIKLSGYFGNRSSVIIADDPDDRPSKSVIKVKNKGQFQGSGTAGSYILAVSRNNSAASGGDITAIDIGNSSLSSIFFAPEGLVEIGNLIGVKEVTAHKLKMANQSAVTYESGLASLLFTSGPTAGWNLIDWQEKL